MAILQVRDIDDRLYASLKQKAQKENRSISQEVISILEKYLANPNRIKENPTMEFLNLSWEDDREADEIIKELRTSRRNKQSFGDFDGLLN
ncbi:antitoxin [Brucepastera parasyntrophica]|uniref:FitA-like ribbon-helix-helix domain-containing protein n=1 Tax=Brucepastera parasyntrophica TaxID=2880008 RepID=UPI00210991A4|nr:antitoxin [Brucepastera parasyntrophica]ULQ58537.1 antitoxin [Brucepastera parasyntrophica]